MSSTKSGLLVCGLGACLLVPVAAGAQQGGADSAPVDVVRTELTLNLRRSRSPSSRDSTPVTPFIGSC